MVPNERFLELLKDIEPSSTTKTDSSGAHTAVRNFLNNHNTFKARCIGDFLAGSYARNTAIRPKKTADGYERPDIDIIIKTNYSLRDAPEAVLKEVGNILGEQFKVERINKRSVKVVTSKAEIDIVPMKHENSVYFLPDCEIGAWKRTNPVAHNAWSEEQNKLFQGRFKPLVKLLKWWRRENKTGKRPKGFVLEVLVAKHAPRDEPHYGKAFAAMLENIVSSYNSLISLNQKPYIEDPGISGNDILSNVSITDWNNFFQRVKIHAEIARRALDEDDMDRATDLWRKLFGNRFKSTTKILAENLTACAVVPGLGAGYMFPNQPVVPKKPRGFA